jgi:hypothetical protein
VAFGNFMLLLILLYIINHFVFKPLIHRFRPGHCPR